MLSTSSPGGRWRVRLSQEPCSQATGRLLQLQEDQCGGGRRRREVPREQEVAEQVVGGGVSGQFFQVVESSSMALSPVSLTVERGSRPRASQTQSSHRKQSLGERRRRKQRWKRKLPLLNPPWLATLLRPSGPPCPAYLTSPSSVLVPAPCLLQASTSSLSLALGLHTSTISTILLHPPRRDHDVALLSLTSPLPPSLPPACLSPLTSKYSQLLLPGCSLAPLPMKTVSRRKCGKLGREEVCVLLEGGGQARPGDPMVREGRLEGLYSRRAARDYHVLKELFHLRLWINQANQSHVVP